MLRWRRKRNPPVDVAAVLERARAFPADDQHRWRVLARLSDADPQAVFDAAAELYARADTESRKLAGQILDELLIGRSDGVRFRRACGEILARVCHATQEPQVLAAALHPYSVACADQALPLLLQLLGHPDAGVRASATQLAACTAEDAPQEHPAVIDELIRLLHDDPDDVVRAKAADGLVVIATADAPRASALASAALRRFRHDPSPALRCCALDLSAPTDPDAAMTGVLTELAAVAPNWRFVSLCRSLLRTGRIRPDLVRQATLSLRRLQAQGWAQQGQPGTYPLADERAEMLREALTLATGGRRKPASC